MPASSAVRRSPKCRRDMGRGARAQPDQRVPRRPHRGAVHGRAPPRQDHQHRLADERGRPQDDLALHRVEGRRAPIDPRDVRRVGGAQHPGQRHRPRLFQDGAERRAAPPTPPSISGSAPARPPADGASRPSSSARRSSSPLPPPISSTARSFTSTAACSLRSEGTGGLAAAKSIPILCGAPRSWQAEIGASSMHSEPVS